MKKFFYSITFLLYLFSISFSQIEDEKIVTEIMSVWKEKGENGLKKYTKTNKDRISNDLITGMSLSGMQERNENLLSISLIIAKEKNDDLILAQVYFDVGDYNYYIGNYDDAKKFYGLSLELYIKFKNDIGLGNVNFREGDIYSRIGENQKALEMYEKALSFFQKANEPLGQGNLYFSEGNIYLQTGENQKALEMYERALPYFQKVNSPLGQGNVYSSEGDIYLNTGENQKALEMYEKALLFYQKANDPLGQGNVYRSEGAIYRYTGENQKALEMYERALPFYQKANDPLGQGNVYRSEGDIYLTTGENQKALEMYEKALPFFQKANYPLGQGNVNKSKGDIYLHTGENQKALEMYEKALPFYQKANSPIGQGSVYRSEGDIYLHTGENQKALEMYEKALPFYQKANEPIGQGNVYFSEGNIYLNTGENQKALQMYDMSLVFFQKANFPQGQGNVYSSEGDIYFNIGDNNKAILMYEKALPFFQKINEPIGQGNVYKSEGDIYLKTGENQKALEMYEKALPFFQKANSPLGQGVIYFRQGDIYLYTRKNQKALEKYEIAYKLFVNCGDIESQAYTLFRKASASENNSTRSILYNNAIQLLEKVRSNTGLSESKKSFMQKIYTLYEESALFMLKNNYKDTSFKYIESMKARVFLDMLAEGLANIDKGIPENLRKERNNNEKLLSSLNKKRTDEYMKNNSDFKIIENLEKEIATVENNLDEIKKQIRIKNPNYASVQYPQAISRIDLQSKILKDNEIILEYFITEKLCYCIVIGKNIFETVNLNIEQSKLELITGQLLKDIENREPNNDKYKERSNQIYKYLLQPVEKIIEGKELIIIPDGILSQLPFETLTLQNGNLLIEKYKIKYVQSATILSLLRTLYKKEGKYDRFIGFGDPVYDYENFKAGKIEEGMDIKGIEKNLTYKDLNKSRFLRSNGMMNRLIGSGIEVDEIGKLFTNQGKSATINKREYATEEKAKDKSLEDYGYIHFSTHGILNDNFQAIALSQIPDSKEDGFLTLGEIMNSKYNANLVVLSACKTGLGKEERGEGITGLTRAVMYAGSPAAIVSLWSVSDEATKDLMIMFYKNILIKKLSKEDALRGAKLEMLKSKNFSAPFFWSAFIMYGE